MKEYQKVYEYLIAHPDESLQSIGRQFNIYPAKLKRNVSRIYGYDFDARLALIEKKREEYIYSKWPEMREALDTEDINYFHIATRFGISREKLSELIKEHGYDIKARGNRIRRTANIGRTKQGYRGEVQQTMKGESMAGEMSLQAHTLPFNEWWRLAA